MTQYLALLRGINVGGKNKIAMKELRAMMEMNGYKEVLTYLNSGNVLFISEEIDETMIGQRIETLIMQNFGLNIPVLILNKNELQNICDNIPRFWNKENKEYYYNLILYIPPFNKNDFLKCFPTSNKEFESVYVAENCVYWAFILKKHSKTTLSKIASSPINQNVTLRTVKTMTKLFERFT